MRVLGLVCECLGAENLVRSVFNEADIKDWLNVPVYKGDRAKSVAKEIAEKYSMSKDAKLLDYYLSNRQGSFAVIVGYDPDTQIVKWADVSTGDVKSKIEGKVIARKFA